MLALKSRRDGFRFQLPDDFLMPEIKKKYTEVLKEKKGFFTNPIDFLNESIQQIQVLGIVDATVQQQQTNKGYATIRDAAKDDAQAQKNADFMFSSVPYTYRNAKSPLGLMDMTFNVFFRNTLGFLNYFMLFENFWYMYARETKYKELVSQFNIDIINEKGVIYSRIVLDSPLVNSMDMLDFDNKQPIAASDSFKVEFKYSNFDFQFLDFDDNPYVDKNF